MKDTPPPPTVQTAKIKPLALKDVIKAAEQGDSESQYTAYKIFGRLPGESTRKQSVKFLTMAAQQEHPQALYYLARTYEMRSNYETAFGYYKKSADKKYAPAYLALSDFYQFGRGTKQDKDKSFDYLERAAHAGINVAQYNYANTIRDDAKDAESLMKASLFFRLAADEQIKFSGVFLKEQTEKCLSASYINDDTLPACLLASYSGDADVEYIISLLYRYGFTMEPSPTESHNWTKKSAYHGNFNAQIDLIRNNLDGFGTKQDITLAYQLYKNIKNCPTPDCNSAERTKTLDHLYNQDINDKVTLWDKISGSL